MIDASRPHLVVEAPAEPGLLSAPVALAAPVQRQLLRETWRRFRKNRGAVVGLTLVLGYVAVAFLAGAISPYDPAGGDLASRLQGPSGQHWLGTDELGRDVLSRLIHGARISLQIQVAAVGLTLVAGVSWGLVAGYFGGWVDDASMRVIDVLLAFPSLLLAVAIVAILGWST